MAIARLSVKVGGSGKAEPHAAYIAREGKYKNRLEKSEKLEATGTGNMPEWAAHNARAFWQAADTYERKNGSTYREHEIALPRELSSDQRLSLVTDWIKNEIGTDHAYQFAIHTPTAADGGEQPHAHLMFCERRNDGIARDPEQYFKRYNRKYPERGGAQKTNFSMKARERKAALKAQRERWQDLCNGHLKRAGLDEQIDMRSYADQGIDQTPEPKMLPSEWRNSEQKNNLIQLREARHHHRQTQTDLQQVIPDAGVAINQLKEDAQWQQQLQPDNIEKVFNQALMQAEGEKKQALNALSKDIDHWVKAAQEHAQNRPDGFFKRKAIQQWERTGERITEAQALLQDEYKAVQAIDSYQEAAQELQRKHPLLARERTRLQQEQQKLAEQQAANAREQARLERERSDKERAALEKAQEEERTRPARLRKEKREVRQRFFADVLRRQNKKEMAKYPALAKLQRETESLAKRTEQPLDELIEKRARQIESGVRRVGHDRSRGHGGLER